MKKMHLLVAGVVIGAGAFVSSAHGSTIFYDNFADGDRNLGSDSQDIQWWVANQNQSVAVSADATSGWVGANSFKVSPGGIDAFKRVVGFFPTTTLGATVGDSLTLSFEFHATTTPPNNANGFRFGLYNSNGTQITGDESSTSYNSSAGTTEADDYGYNARVPTGSTVAPNLIKEPAGDNTLGGSAGGTTILTSSSNIGINDQLRHTFSFVITRASATTSTFTMSMDSTPVAAGTDNGSLAPLGLITNFDAVYFGTGSSNAFTYALGDVLLVNSVSVPEPASISGILVASGLLLYRRRRPA